MQPTRCAICQTTGQATELYPANFRFEDLTPAAFSARRSPDRLHYRLVRCQQCGLVRSDPIAPPELLERLYQASEFTYQAEVADLRHTYGRQLERISRFGARKGALLEIGCGNGFFLEEALAQGYLEACGVEPSRHAVAAAGPKVKDRIRNELFRPGMFKPATFDVICLFQVMDHFPDPGSVLEECHRLTVSGGHVLAINHNVQALSARLLGRFSPIFDIEHTFLYSPRTMRLLFAKSGFEVLSVGPVVNRFALRYLLQLSPLPRRLKSRIVRVLQAIGAGGLRLSLPLGNLALIARKPRG